MEQEIQVDKEKLQRDVLEAKSGRNRALIIGVVMFLVGSLASLILLYTAFGSDESHMGTFFICFPLAVISAIVALGGIGFFVAALAIHLKYKILCDKLK